MLYPFERQGASVAMPVTFARVLIAACSLARSMMKTLFSMTTATAAVPGVTRKSVGLDCSCDGEENTEER